MSSSLYLARRPRSAAPALLVIVKGRQAAGLVSCRSALLLAARPSTPVLREFSTPATAGGGETAGIHPDELLHRLALGQAACDATDAFGPVLPADFERAAWSSLLRRALAGHVACEALAMAADHVGSMDGSGQLRGVARTLRALRRRPVPASLWAADGP